MPHQVVKDKFVKDLISALLGLSGETIPLHIKDASLSLLGSLFSQEVGINGFEALYDEYIFNFKLIYGSGPVQGSVIPAHGLPEEKSLILHHKIFSIYYDSLEQMKSVLIPLIKLDDLIDDNDECFKIDDITFNNKYFEKAVHIRKMAYQSLNSPGINVSMLKLAHDRGALFPERLLDSLSESFVILKDCDDFQWHMDDLKLVADQIKVFCNLENEDAFQTESEVGFRSESESGYDCKSEFYSVSGGEDERSLLSNQSQLSFSASSSTFEEKSASNGSSHSGSDSGDDSSVDQSSVSDENLRSGSQSFHQSNLSPTKRKANGLFPSSMTKRFKKGKGGSDIPTTSARAGENGLFSHIKRRAPLSEVPFEKDKVKKPRI